MGLSILSKAKIKIDFLISYNYRYIYDALKIVYDHGDEIILPIKINRIAWAGGKYEIESGFYDRSKHLASKSKITIFEVIATAKLFLNFGQRSMRLISPNSLICIRFTKALGKALSLSNVPTLKSSFVNATKRIRRCW